MTPASAGPMLPGTPSSPGSFSPIRNPGPHSARIACTVSLTKRVRPAQSPP